MRMRFADVQSHFQRKSYLFVHFPYRFRMVTSLLISPISCIKDFFLLLFQWMAPVVEGFHCDSSNNQHDYNQRSWNNAKKKPRHTPASRKEATRRERIRVQELRLAYRSLQIVLNIPTRGRPRYLHILQSAISYIRFLESSIGLSRDHKPSCGIQQNEESDVRCLQTSHQLCDSEVFHNAIMPSDAASENKINSPTEDFEFFDTIDFTDLNSFEKRFTSW